MKTNTILLSIITVGVIILSTCVCFDKYEQSKSEDYLMNQRIEAHKQEIRNIYGLDKPKCEICGMRSEYYSIEKCLNTNCPRGYK